MELPHYNASDRKRNLLFAGAGAFFFLAFAFQLWFHAVRASPTIDEPTHILAGRMHWRCGDFGINPEHPPFLKLLATVGLNFRDQSIQPSLPCGEGFATQPEVFVAGANFLIGNGTDEILIPSRLMSATLSLLFATLVFVMSLVMFGRWEAVVALAIVAFEPNLIAHGSLVTTDMAITLAALASTFALYRYATRPSLSGFAVAGLAFGFLLGAKHSAIILLPIFMLVFVADAIIECDAHNVVWKSVLRRTAVFVALCVVGVALLWSLYGFRYSALPKAGSSEIVSVERYISERARTDVNDSLSAHLVRGVARLHVLPESYVLGLADVVASSSRNATIFNRNYATGKWFYFPIAFLVKSSIPLLVLFPCGLFLIFVAKEKRRELLFLLVPPTIFFALSITSKINIGVRHILPVYGFFIVVAAAGAVWANRRFTYFRWALILLLVFHVATAFRTTPNYIGFANDLWGGTNNAYKIFPVDSNLDWGQNEKLVAEYLERENVTDCWYAGWGSLELMNSIVPCRQMPNTFPRASVPLSDPIPPVIEGTVLVNVANLPPKGGNEYVPMTLQKPVTRIGGSIFVYRGRFQVRLASALSHAQRADELVRLGRIDEAVAEGRHAVELADYDPRPHLALGLALLRLGNKSEAKTEFEAALETGRADLGLFRNINARARHELRQMAIEQEQNETRQDVPVDSGGPK